MDIGFDLKNRMQDASQARLDWSGLRSRLFASRAAYRAFKEQCAERPAIGVGSFDRDSASFLARFEHVSTSVNPNALGNGKPDRDIDDPVVGECRTGDRG